MKAYLKKITALSMAALLVLSLAACGGNDDEPSTDPSGNAIVDNSEDVNTPDASEDVNTPDASEDASNEDPDADPETPADPANPDTPADPANPDKPADPKDPTKPATPDNKPSKPADKTSLTAQEALDLFNKATVGKSKNGTRNTKVDLNKLPGGLDNIKGTLQGMIDKKTGDVALTKFENQTLTMADCSNVNAVKSGNNWKITVSVKNTTAANAKAFAELPQDEINGWLDNLKVSPRDSIKFNYQTGTIVATVTPDGKVVNATYTMKVNVEVKNATAKIGFIPITVSEASIAVSQTDTF